MTFHAAVETSRLTAGYNLTEVILGVIAIAAVLGTVVAIFKANLARSTIELQDQNIEALKERVLLLEADKVKHDEDLRVAREQIAILSQLATGTDAITALSDKQDRQHAELLHAIRRAA